MKKALLWMLILVMSVSMTAVVSLADSSGGAKVEKEYEVAWLAPMESIGWFYVRQGMEEIIAKTLEEKGWKITVTQMAPVVRYDISEQVTQFENMISKKVNAIAVCPINEQGIVPLVEEAVDVGISVISLSATIPSDKILTQCRPNEVESNKQLAIHAIKNNGGAGKCIILFGMLGNITSNERLLGFKEGIAEFPDCEILDIQPVEFNYEKGMTVMENMLTKYPKIDFVFCVNDKSAIGAYEAIAAAGRADEIIVVGHDGGVDGLDYVKDGKIKYTCCQDYFQMGRDTITALVEYWSGNKVTKDQYTYVCKIIDKDNVQPFLDEYDEMEKWYKIK